MDGLDPTETLSDDSLGYETSGILPFHPRPSSSRGAILDSPSNRFAAATPNEKLDTWQLDLAVEQGHIETLDVLLKGNDITFEKWIRQQLLQASLYDKRSLVDCLIRHGGRVQDTAHLDRILAKGLFETLETLLKQDERTEIEIREQPPGTHDRKLLARHRTWSKFDTQRQKMMTRSGATIDELPAETLENQEILHLLNKDLSPFSQWKKRKLLAACVAPNSCRDRNEQVVKFFLGQGVPVDSRDLPLGDLDGYKTALHVAVGHGHINIVSILLSRGADVNKLSNTFRSPLHDAALSGAVDMIAILLENGASVDSRDEASYQPLHFASRSGSCEAVRLLLLAGARIDCVGNDGLQPLHHTAQFCDSSGLAILLVNHGASINAMTQFGYTPLELACESGHFLVVQDLLSLGAQLRAPYRCHYPGEIMTNPLGLAVINRHLDIAQELLSQGADPNIYNSATGTSAIHILAACHRAAIGSTASPLSTTADCIQLLLKWGAEIGSCDHGGRQVFHYLAKYPPSDLHRKPETHAIAMREVATVLKRAGADIDACDLCGVSPLDDAVGSLKSWVVRILLEHGASRIGSHVVDSLIPTTRRDANEAADNKERVLILDLLKQYKAV